MDNNDIFNRVKSLKLETIVSAVKKTRQDWGLIACSPGEIKCKNPNCGGSIKFKRKLISNITNLIENNKTSGDFIINCQNTENYSNGRRACLYSYIFKLKIENKFENLAIE